MIKVHKFGGDITVERDSLLEIIGMFQNTSDPVIITCSAVRGVTDKIIQVLNDIINTTRINELIQDLRKVHMQYTNDISNDILDSVLYQLKNKLEDYEGQIIAKGELRNYLMSFGERMITAILQQLWESMTSKHVTIADPVHFIKLDRISEAANVLLEETEIIAHNLFDKLLKEFDVILVPGYYGSTLENSTSLLGRSGTDLTASTLGYALNADEVVIWKNVDAFMTVDPIFIPTAQTIDHLSYDEAGELAHFGAKILHPRTIIPAKLRNIPIVIRNFQCPRVSTHIQSVTYPKPSIVKSISYLDNLCKVRLHVSHGGSREGVLASITSILAKSHINIITILTSHTCVSLLIKETDASKIHQIINPLRKLVDGIDYIYGNALICIVGEGIGITPGIAASVFQILSHANINVGLISAGASETAYHFTVSADDLVPAVKAIHKHYFELEVLN